jgi:PII-like signaling protein
MSVCTRLRIYLNESDKTAHRPRYLALLEQARQSGLAGCTVVRAIAGFGAGRIVRSDHLVTLGEPLPVIIEIIDLPLKIDAFVRAQAELLSGTFATFETVNVVSLSKAA